MINNFNIYADYVMGLVDKLLDDKSFFDEKTHNKYCKAFEQLLEIVESEKETVNSQKLEILLLKIHLLEEKYSNISKELKAHIDNLRYKAVFVSSYSQNTKESSKGTFFNKIIDDEQN